MQSDAVADDGCNAEQFSGIWRTPEDEVAGHIAVISSERMVCEGERERGPLFTRETLECVTPLNTRRTGLVVVGIPPGGSVDDVKNFNVGLSFSSAR